MDLEGISSYRPTRKGWLINTFLSTDTRVDPEAYNENMGPDYDRWSDANDNNVQDPVKMSPLEDVPITDPLERGTDTETIQNQATHEETQTQENIQTFDRTVELVDSQSLHASTLERKL